MARLVLLAVSLGAATTSQAAPHLAGAVSDPGCRAALTMAQRAFASSSSSLDWPIADTGQALRIVLKQNAEDISGGSAVEADRRLFSVSHLKGEEGAGSLFWSLVTSDNYRLAIVDRPYGWRGDSSLFTRCQLT